MRIKDHIYLPIDKKLMYAMQIESTKRMIKLHGLEAVIDYYLDCYLEILRFDQYWYNGLVYCSKLI